MFQGPQRWPIIFRSARKVLRTDGLLGRKVIGIDGYLEFVQVFRALSEGLGLGFWDWVMVGCQKRYESKKSKVGIYARVSAAAICTHRCSTVSHLTPEKR